MPPKSKTNREAILKEAIRIVEEEGLAELSLRSLARSLDLSPNAIYHYFPDRCALEADVAREGWKRLLAALQRSRRNLPADRAVGQQVKSFVRFTERHPALYRLMLVPPETEEETAILNQYREFNVLSYGPLVPLEEVDRTRRLVWSLLHGMTSLHRAGMTPEIKDLGRESAEAVQILLAGLGGTR